MIMPTILKIVNVKYPKVIGLIWYSNKSRKKNTCNVTQDLVDKTITKKELNLIYIPIKE